MIETEMHRESGKVSVQLSINMQIWLEVYVEPIPGKPETYETEERVYKWTDEKLLSLVAKALEKIQALQKEVFLYRGYEEAGLTYGEVELINFRHGTEGTAGKPYEAAEDLVFVYGALHVLYDFVYEARCILEP